jgi:hypothetical protein
LVRHLRIPVLIRVGIEQKVGTVEAASERRIVVVHAVEIPELANIISAVPCILHPSEEVAVVDPLLDDLGVSAVGRGNISNVVVVRRQSSPKSCSGRTTESYSAIMLLVRCSFAHNVILLIVRPAEPIGGLEPLGPTYLQMRHMLNAFHVKILVIC